MTRVIREFKYVKPRNETVCAKALAATLDYIIQKIFEDNGNTIFIRARNIVKQYELNKGNIPAFVGLVLASLADAGILILYSNTQKKLFKVHPRFVEFIKEVHKHG